MLVNLHSSFHEKSLKYGPMYSVLTVFWLCFVFRVKGNVHKHAGNILLEYYLFFYKFFLQCMVYVNFTSYVSGFTLFYWSFFLPQPLLQPLLNCPSISKKLQLQMWRVCLPFHNLHLLGWHCPNLYIKKLNQLKYKWLCNIKLFYQVQPQYIF